MYLGAAALIDLGEQQKSLEWIEKALSIDPSDPVMLYNTACVYSQAGKAGEAIAYLEKALDNGYANREWVDRDPDLDGIRNDPRFRGLIDRM
jgi:tetratricopeptide (TPR) repeat protein